LSFVSSLHDSLLQETRSRLLNAVESFLSSSRERVLVGNRQRAAKPTLKSTAQSLGLASFIRQPTKRKRGGVARTYDAEDRNYSGLGSGWDVNERDSGSSRRNDIQVPGKGEVGLLILSTVGSYEL
jgi:hypothetical protein